MSKMISEANASRRHKQTHKIFRVSLLFFGAVGIFCSLVMFFGANFFAAVMNDTKAARVYAGTGPVRWRWCPGCPCSAGTPRGTAT